MSKMFPNQVDQTKLTKSFLKKGSLLARVEVSFLLDDRIVYE